MAEIHYLPNNGGGGVELDEDGSPAIPSAEEVRRMAASASGGEAVNFPLVTTAPAPASQPIAPGMPAFRLPPGVIALGAAAAFLALLWWLQTRHGAAKRRYNPDDDGDVVERVRRQRLGPDDDDDDGEDDDEDFD